MFYQQKTQMEQQQKVLQHFNAQLHLHMVSSEKTHTNYLSFDDGTQYIPVGEDMGWQDNNVVTDYTNWLGKLSSNGGNFIRVWMSDWAFALEWKNGNNGYSGLEQYKQTSAYYLDWLLDKCSSLNVYMMLCLNHHGQVSTQCKS